MPARRGGNARLHQRTASTTSTKQVANQNAAQAAVANALSKGGLKRNGNSAVEVRGPSSFASCSSLISSHFPSSKIHSEILLLLLETPSSTLHTGSSRRTESTRKTDYNRCSRNGRRHPYRRRSSSRHTKEASPSRAQRTPTRMNGFPARVVQQPRSSCRPTTSRTTLSPCPPQPGAATAVAVQIL